MELKELLKYRNYAGTVYGCDIDRWLGVPLDYKKRDDLQKKLTEIADAKNKRSGKVAC